MGRRLKAFPPQNKVEELFLLRSNFQSDFLLFSALNKSEVPLSIISFPEVIVFLNLTFLGGEEEGEGLEPFKFLKPERHIKLFEAKKYFRVLRF